MATGESIAASVEVRLGGDLTPFVEILSGSPHRNRGIGRRKAAARKRQ